MKTKRIFLFRAGIILILLIIASIMMIIGRGHTVYMDNKTLDYNGQTYKTPYKVVVTVDGKQVAKLYDKERGLKTCIGQKFRMNLEITQEKGGSEETVAVALTLPYGMDNIAINLPAYLAGLPADAYLSEFIIAPEKAEEPSEGVPGEEVLPIDEFPLGDI